ncbi:FAD:protein FMN transferase [Prosthecobacter sp.]|uniref:FAD:protein FMN transferase n=1 Tax=Prosthecobacter sp. TaxID=1965333 RepID=UPI002ABB70F6|nr:FAD:protein FMN transferase [Prosthecobacter sp.]MDZ4401857.1 FAD:protein FMN transferase [Prosthecobacter sp.]
MNTDSASLNRRRFLMGTAGACAVLGTGGWLWSRERPWQVFRRTSHALGSSITMSVWHRDEAAAEAALDAAFAELDLVESLMSIYRPESQLSRLNQNAALDDPHPHLVTVLEYAMAMAKETNGALDVTVQPLWELYHNAKKQNRLPSEAEVIQARALVDWRRVKITPSRLQLDGAGTAITLNGIAQGFAADAAMAVLRRAGVAHALIDAGEMNALGGKPDGAAFTVGIQHPRHADAFVSMAKLQDRCLATSGDYETRFSEDFVHHHLFDPRTGHSPTELASVSIVAPTAMAADALSTAVFVLGIERGMGLVRHTPGTDALLVSKSGRITATEGFPLNA